MFFYDGDDGEATNVPLGQEEEEQQQQTSTTSLIFHENNDVIDDDVNNDHSGNDDEEDDDAYRLRVYGTTESIGEESNIQQQQRSSQRSTATPRRKVSNFRRLSRQVSQQFHHRRSSIIETLPESPTGWTVLISTLLSTVLGYELRVQKSLTVPPMVFGQLPTNSIIKDIHSNMSQTSSSILSRPIKPSLFVGTRGTMSSAAAYLLGGPKTSNKELFIRFREVVTSSIDGAQIAVDWEIPASSNTASRNGQQNKQTILHGPIQQPVVIILHGINNHSRFGYMRSLSRTFVERGWNAASMNFRGCGGIQLTTPRSYNASYTGDLRHLVLKISSRLGRDVPIFLVGNSLGANLVTKYLGEECLAGTLPGCVAGGVSLGNPLLFDAKKTTFPYNYLIGNARKLQYLEQWSVFAAMKDPTFQSAVRKALLSKDFAAMDRAIAPTQIRNDSFDPYKTSIGYDSGESYWTDSASYRLVSHISVPFLLVTAEDDMLVYGPSKKKLSYCLANPNILVVESRCGGHLGWQESPPESSTIFGSTSWADTVTADFFDSILNTSSIPSTKQQQEQQQDDSAGTPFGESNPSTATTSNISSSEKREREIIRDEASKSLMKIRSRL